MRGLIAAALLAGCGHVTATPDGAAPDAVAAADAIPRAAQLRAAIDGVVTGPMAQPGAVGLVVGVIDGDDTLIATYGVATLGGAPPTETTLFEIGSNSKTFTATLLAWYAQQHAVALTDPLNAYLPAQYQFAANSPKASITLEELADHTSGLPRNPTDVATGATSYTDNQMDADADALTLGAAPGTTFVYSNLGYALLGEALADHAGQAWKGLVHDVITAPLGMPDTALYPDLTADQLARAATGYADTAIGACTTPPCAVSPSQILLAFPPPAVNPAGGLYASPDDLMTWLAYNLGRSSQAQLTALLDTLRHKRVQTGPGDWVGLAWNTSTYVDAQGSHDLVWKDGDTNGFHSYVGYLADEQRGVFVLANFPITTAPNQLGQQVLARLP